MFCPDGHPKDGLCCPAFDDGPGVDGREGELWPQGFLIGLLEDACPAEEGSGVGWLGCWLGC